ncbi:C45 family peptidase [Mesonia sp. K7]|uniref:C45 family autoproteolytic acyltransferase/hydolase n=1 Tax=Mesonia sp. K7 TaxID=2218606 RepID=UPI000DAA8328|nr:C45 family peptidase [Mesonia sp. K7]PZD76836.1 acyl-CoA--6-aminopenicillanic acid acyl-transferase [Mesonia sp. K7]
MRSSWLYIILSFLLFTSCGIKKSLNNIPDYQLDTLHHFAKNYGENLKVYKNNSLLKNQYGIWEMYIEGDALERGTAIGILTKELMQKQEQIFLEKVESLVPEQRMNLLKKITAYYNRHLDYYVLEEYKKEIFALSQYMTPKYNDLAHPYKRALYLHAAHDIGHALQDLMLVGCTSFAVWGDKSYDGNLLLGRNFDFYAGDDFAEEKIVAFINPDTGNKFTMLTWPGFIGVVSGMNEKGITVTINAGKSKIPWSAKTPIALVTREILQYANSIEEAIEIAKNKEVFVSEAIMVGSAKENKAVLIELSPKNFGVYEVENSDKLLCTNHFQSENYKDDKRNLITIEESHTQPRFLRLQELINEEEKINPTKAVEILRDKKGVDNNELGFGNELAINQLLAHHSIVFQPNKLRFWVSTKPYQLGEFIAYDLGSAFADFETGLHNEKLIPELTIPADSFLTTQSYKNYEKFRLERKKITDAIENNLWLEDNYVESFVALNPEFWETYKYVGDYYFEHQKFEEASKYYQIAMTKEVTTQPDLQYLKKQLRKSKRKF